ncbi:MAG TPA: hydroxymethylbilane synthase [Longimicrobiales bacterium]|nr:hydroxymethylbilane synthase [Longimicrobiales bacterium]
MNLRLGTRGSRLALWQAHHVKDRLEAAHPGLRVEIVVLETIGDRIQDVPLARIGDRGLFTKELDRAILDGRVDAAVHSLKDVPTRLPAGLGLAAVLEREDPRDVVIPAPGRPATLDALPPDSRIGTSSLRRRAQVLHRRPDLQVLDLRGNLDTRLGRLAERHYDAVILAAAGVRRLGREALIGAFLEPPGWLPAAGQGALGIAAREGDDDVASLLSALDHPDARRETTAERAFLRELEGGCQIPIGALARTEGELLRLDGFVGSLDGRTLIRGSIEAPAGDPEEAGRRLAADLLERGAKEVLEQVRAAAIESLPRASAP